jgi:hypothetical protein
MNSAAQLSGFYAAHAIWCLSDGENVTPMLARLVDDEATMERLDEDDFEESVDAGRERLAGGDDPRDAALLYDASIEIEGDEVDAIVVEIRSADAPESEVVLAVPYTLAADTPFVVHRPRLLAWTNCDAFDVQEFMEAFFAGVDAHEQGAKVWNQHLDESN